MNIEFIYPAPAGLPVPVRPPRGSPDILQMIQKGGWRKVYNLRSDALARAGAFWLHGFLDEAHQLAQKDRTAEGSYWHALMHRSEGDFSNSMYWYQKVGKHAIFPALRAEVEKMEGASGSFEKVRRNLLLESQWNPARFVDLCQLACQGRFGEPELLQRVAAAEYNLLMDYVLRRG
ncbi:MAG: hypothetical protein DMG06_02240 [Acidobacteria bacterium]|nr:MAG: hypothetical protein DMG06_02240 [Acidobacteriota bacterium]